MNITTDDKRMPVQAPVRRSHVLMLSVAAQAILFALLWFAGPLRTSSIKFDPEEMVRLDEEVQKRNRVRIEKERERRERVVIKEKDAEKLRKKAKAEEEKKAVDKIREMREVRDLVQQLRAKSLTKLKGRTLDDFNANKMDDLLTIANRIAEHSFHFETRSSQPFAKRMRPLCVRLPESTSQFLDRADWTMTAELSRDATEIKDAVTAEFSNVEARFPDAEKRKGQFPHLFLWGSNICRDVDLFVDKLSELHTSQDQLADLNDLGDTQVESPTSNDAPLDSMELSDLVDEAKQLGAEISEDYAEMRAAEIAMLENSTYKDAMSKVVSAASDTPSGEAQAPSQNANSKNSESSSASDRKKSGNASASPASGSRPQGATTVGDLQQYRQQVAAMGSQATAHWTKAVNMGQRVGAIGGKQKTGRSAAAFGDQANSNSSSNTQSKGSSQGNGGSDGGSKTSSSIGAGSLTKTTSRGGNAGGLRTKIPPEMIKAKALPGRRFNDRSSRQGWLFLDTWYVIGPWRSAGQPLYSVVHPPEIAVDLDAVYMDNQAKETDSQPLKWQFVQSDIMRITPPKERSQSTYYAFTEVYFDRPGKMLAAIATDDAARMWVNDKLVWEDEGHSGWNLNEGFRVIEFDKGFNKFLIRIENGPGLCEFSVLLCPPDQVTK